MKREDIEDPSSKILPPRKDCPASFAVLVYHRFTLTLTHTQPLRQHHHTSTSMPVDRSPVRGQADERTSSPARPSTRGRSRVAGSDAQGAEHEQASVLADSGDGGGHSRSLSPPPRPVTRAARSDRAAPEAEGQDEVPPPRSRGRGRSHTPNSSDEETEGEQERWRLEKQRRVQGELADILKGFTGAMRNVPLAQAHTHTPDRTTYLRLLQPSSRCTHAPRALHLKLSRLR